MATAFGATAALGADRAVAAATSRVPPDFAFAFDRDAAGAPPFRRVARTASAGGTLIATAFSPSSSASPGGVFPRARSQLHQRVRRAVDGALHSIRGIGVQRREEAQRRQPQGARDGIAGGAPAEADAKRRAVAARQPPWKYLVAGAVAGVVSRTVVSPLEVVATTSMSSSTVAQNFIHQLGQVFRREGVRGLFKGNMANCLKVAPTKGIQFVAFEAWKRGIAWRRGGMTGHGVDDIELTAGERLFAGGMAGIAAALVCYPLEVSKTLLTAEPGRYRGVFGALRTLAAERGAGSLYRGLAPTLVAMFPYVGLEFMAYEQLKMKMTHGRGDDERLNTWTLLAIGAVAGTLAQTACHPLDVVRKRLQLQGIGNRPVQYSGMLHVAREIVQREGGASALYKGLMPAVTSVFPGAGVGYVIYEWAKRALGATSL